MAQVLPKHFDSDEDEPHPPPQEPESTTPPDPTTDSPPQKIPNTEEVLSKFSWALYKPPKLPKNIEPKKTEISIKLLVLSGWLIECLLGEDKKGTDITTPTQVRLFLED